MTILKSNCIHNSPVSSSSKLVGKLKPISVYGLIAKTSHLLLKSISGLQNSFFTASTSNRFKQSDKPLAIVQPTSSEITRICGPMELRGIELITKFGIIVKNIEERKSMTNHNVLQPVKTLSSGVNLNVIKILPTSKVVSAPVSKSCILSEILEASKVLYQFDFTSIYIPNSYYILIVS